MYLTHLVSMVSIYVYPFFLKTDVNVDLELKDDWWHLDTIMKSVLVASTNYGLLGHTEVHGQ